jgi:hypothetical protein
MGSLVTPLPLLPLVPHLLLQAYSVGMVRANGSLCAAPLLADPLTVQRIRAFHGGMHLLALLLPGKATLTPAGRPACQPASQPASQPACEQWSAAAGVATAAANAAAAAARRGCDWQPLPLPMPTAPEAAPLLAAAGGVGPTMSLLLQRSSPAQQCEASLSFLFLAVGMFLPLALLLRTEPAISLQAWEEGQAAGGCAGSRGGRLAAGLEAALRQLCGRSWLAPSATAGAGPPLREAEPEEADGQDAAAEPRVRLLGWQRSIAWWLLLSSAWGASLAAAL